MPIRAGVFAFLAFVAVIFVFTVIFGSWYTIDEGERGVVLRNGATVAIADPGLHFKMPLVDTVVKISTQVRAKVYADIPTYSKDQQTAMISLSINYRMPHDKVMEIYTQYGGEEGLVTRVIDRRVNELVKTVFGKFNAVSAIQDRTRLNFEVAEAIQKVVHGPVIIDSVQIENIDFSNAYENSVEQRMLAEVEVQKVRQNAEKEKISAEIVVIKAEAEADAVRAQAQAQADAIRLRGDAEAQAIDARGNALMKNPTLIELVQAERWNGSLPTTMIPGSAVPFLNVAPKTTRVATQ